MSEPVSVFACFLNRQATCFYCTRHAAAVCSFVTEGYDGNGSPVSEECGRAICGQCARERSGFSICRFHGMKVALDKAVAAL